MVLAVLNFGRFQRLAIAMLARAKPLGVYWADGVESQTVVLTIDDGPSSRTAEMLDLLRDYGATATFFVHTDHVDGAAGGGALITRMLAEGHEIGNHMPSDTPSIQLSAAEFARGFAESDQRLRELGADPKLFRPAGGAYADSTMGPALDRYGYEHRYVLGSYLPWDVYYAAPQRYARQLVGGAYPGAIFVLHDGDHHEGRAERTLTTLRLLLAGLQDRGFTARSLMQARVEAEAR